MATYQLIVKDSVNHGEYTCKVYRCVSGNKNVALTVKRGRSKTEAMKEALREVRLLRRGKMLPAV